jgi:hypothetical protein
MGSADRSPTARPCRPATAFDFRQPRARARGRAREGKCWRSRLTISATARPVSRSAVILPWSTRVKSGVSCPLSFSFRSTGRIDRWSMSASQASSAATGQVADLRDRGIPISRPCPSWSVFDRRTRIVRPAWVMVISSRSSAISSERRIAAPKPTSSTARSRQPPGFSTRSLRTMRRRSSVNSARLATWRVP